MNPNRLSWIVALAAVVSGHALADAACRAESGALTRPVVELYTSEGCDSCPPADRWFSSTFADARSGPIPLAFHVDYWDRLGWTDRFASPAYTERQHAAADANHASFVYTPQVLLQGHDLAWRESRATAALGRSAAEPAHVRITLAGTRDGGALRVQAVASRIDTPLPADARLSLAYVDSDLKSDVKAGENRGVRLHHDHVVRSLVSASRSNGRDGITADATLALPAEAGRDPAVVAFVQRARDGSILQAVSLPLTDCPTH
jgi:hypothetical protein